ncbi:SDR family oxidoreductase [Actinocrispum sp. NPDC049592]|uniref:SDR family oxidoreductase n=1 Tax=Actinocrispum sp. NPDC049592 TaxID=3154835 RepID=UPI003429A6C2
MRVRRNILITGASSGLGAEMARQFAAKGRNLALCARRADRLDQLRAALLDAYPEITVSVRPLDVDDHDAVFRVFHQFSDELGTIDRVVVNAGIGDGKPIGTGGFAVNTRVAQTNFMSALAQCEAAMEIFRAQNSGHLVVISSLTALRGFRGGAAVYAATKAGISSLAEGIRGDMLRRPISVTTIQPGFIRTEMNEKAGYPMMAGVEQGVRSIVHAIEREKAVANVPRWPWSVIGVAMKVTPLRLLAKFT